MQRQVIHVTEPIHTVKQLREVLDEAMGDGTGDAMLLVDDEGEPRAVCLSIWEEWTADGAAVLNIEIVECDQ